MASAAAVAGATLPALPVAEPGTVRWDEFVYTPYRFNDGPPLDIAAVISAEYGRRLMAWMDGVVVHGGGADDWGQQ